MKRALTFILALGLVAPAFPGDMAFSPDQVHTVIGFRAATLIFKVPGAFRSWQAEISGDPNTLANAKVTFAIDAKSIDTAQKTRDTHLRSADFFDVARYPKITFVSSKLWREGGKLMVAGSLDMHGVKKEVTVAFEESKGKNGAGQDTWSYEANLKLNRKDFGIGSDSIGAKISLKDEVELNLMLVGWFEEAAEKAAPARKATAKAGKKAA